MGYTSTVIKNASWACLMTWKTILPTRQLSLNLAIRSLKYYACYPRLAAQPHPYSLHFLRHYLFHYILTFSSKDSARLATWTESQHDSVCVLLQQSSAYCTFATPISAFMLSTFWPILSLFIHCCSVEACHIYFYTTSYSLPVQRCQQQDLERSCLRIHSQFWLVQSFLFQPLLQHFLWLD